jgi:hypothetical protein
MANTTTPLQRSDYVQISFDDSNEWRAVISRADSFMSYFRSGEVKEQIAAANQPRTNSKEVQEVLLPKAKELGFRSEAKGLFDDYATSALRPDYYCPIGETGIILEVERGQTTTNNNDLRNFWKCHICTQASYLFLFVPLALRHNEQSTPKNEYKRVNDRLEAFFRPSNYTNVRGLVVFGY